MGLSRLVDPEAPAAKFWMFETFLRAGFLGSCWVFLPKYRSFRIFMRLPSLFGGNPEEHDVESCAFGG